MTTPDAIELFACAPLRARLSVRQCAVNHRDAQEDAPYKPGVAGRRLGIVATCRDCEIGRAHAEGIDVPIERVRVAPRADLASPPPKREAATTRTTTSRPEVPVPTKITNKPIADANKIVADVVQRKLNPKDVAEAHGVSVATVYYHLKKAGHQRSLSDIGSTTVHTRKKREPARVAFEIVQPEVRAIRINRALLLELLGENVPDHEAAMITVDTECEGAPVVIVRFEVAR